MTRPDNWRTRLADWLTGGKLSRYGALLDNAHIRHMDDIRYISGEAGRFRDALEAIADMETPSANATVKRMAARARKALGD